jgi:hypothetical protein
MNQWVNELKPHPYQFLNVDAVSVLKFTNSNAVEQDGKLMLGQWRADGHCCGV